MWLSLETLDQFEGKAKLGTQHRPVCVGYWVSVARAARMIPIGCSFEEYETTFWKWWISLQPSFRKNDVTENGKLEMVAPPAGAEWKKLDGTGANGVLSILASLCFWAHPIMKLPESTYREMQTRERELKKWTGALADVEFAVAGVLASRN